MAKSSKQAKADGRIAAWMRTLAWAVAAATSVTACNRDAERSLAPAQAPAPPVTRAVVAKPATWPPNDPRWLRWQGVVAPAARWSAVTTADVLIRAGAPGLAPDAADAALRPTAAALRGVPGVEQVVTRARAGEVRIVVRFAATAAKGAAALQAVLAAWQTAPPIGIAEPQTDVIVRGARALAALEMVAMGGRVEATQYADNHPDALIVASQFATRTHLAGAVRPLLALRPAPSALQSHGVALNDVVEALHAWLANASAPAAPPPLDEARIALEEIKVKRHWTANGEQLPPVTLDRLVDLSIEQGEPTREARNGHLPTTLWLVDAAVTGETSDIDAAARKVASESKGVFRPSVQALGAAYRFVVVAPEGDAVKYATELSDRLRQLRMDNESVVALNAIAGHDGVPEELDGDAQDGRVWTVWVSIATPDAGPMILAVREALSREGWEAHALSNSTDTAMAWVLDAWGAGGALISADDGASLAPQVTRLAQRALTGREKAGMRQGPQPAPAPLAFRRIDPKGLAATKLTVAGQQEVVETLNGMRPLGWWHATPVWLGLPVGDLAATVGQLPLNWLAPGGSGPGHAWIASDVLRVPDTTPLVERIRVNGRPALWAVPEVFADAPDGVSMSFWRMTESIVDMQAGMRVDALDVKQKPLVSDGASARPAP